MIAGRGMDDADATPAGTVPRSQRRIPALIEAAGCVLSTRIALSLRRTKAVRRGIAAMTLGRPPRAGDLRVVAWSVRATARAIPGATCLTQALAGQRMLARRGIASDVRITLPGDAAAGLAPHAWLLCGDTILLGGSAAEAQAHRTLVVYGADGSTRGRER